MLESGRIEGEEVEEGEEKVEGRESFLKRGAMLIWEKCKQHV